MSILNSVIKLFVGDKQQKDLKILQPIVDDVRKFEVAISNLSNDGLRAKTLEFKEKIKTAIEAYTPTNNRSQRIEKDTNQIILDAYNANPTSMLAALEFLNASGSFISSDCGGISANDFMPYGMHLKKQYAYGVDNALVVRDLSSVSLFVVYPNPTESGIVNDLTTYPTIDAALLELANLKEGDKVNVSVHSGGTITMVPETETIAPERAKQVAELLIKKNDKLFDRLSK